MTRVKGFESAQCAGCSGSGSTGRAHPVHVRCSRPPSRLLVTSAGWPSISQPCIPGSVCSPLHGPGTTPSFALMLTPPPLPTRSARASQRLAWPCTGCGGRRWGQRTGTGSTSSTWGEGGRGLTGSWAARATIKPRHPNPNRNTTPSTHRWWDGRVAREGGGWGEGGGGWGEGCPAVTRQAATGFRPVPVQRVSHVAPM